MQPGEPAPEGMSYIAASYVKFIEVSHLNLVAKLERKLSQIALIIQPTISHCYSNRNQPDSVCSAGCNFACMSNLNAI